MPGISQLSCKIVQKGIKYFHLDSNESYNIALKALCIFLNLVRYDSCQELNIFAQQIDFLRFSKRFTKIP